MIFLGRWGLPKGFRNRRDSWKGFADDIPGSELEGIRGRDSQMTFLGRRDSRKGFQKERDSWKGFMDDISGQNEFTVGIQERKGFAEGIHR